MHKRIKQIREHFKLTQEEFGKRIGSARNTIANYENGNRNPSNSVVLSICREFRVNEVWLRTGEGEMFLPLSDSRSLDALAKANHATEADYQLIRNYLSLDSSVRLQIQSLFSTKE